MTQPVATVIAGSLAVVAAAIAFIGLLVNLHYQRRTERRSRAIDQITEAVAAVETLTSVLVWLPKADSGSDSAKRGNEKALDALERVQIATARLEVYGLDRAASATRAYMNAALSGVGNQATPPADTGTAGVAGRAHAIQLLQHARRQLEMGVIQTAFKNARTWIKRWRNRTDE